MGQGTILISPFFFAMLEEVAKDRSVKLGYFYSVIAFFQKLKQKTQGDCIPGYGNLTQAFLYREVV